MIPRAIHLAPPLAALLLAASFVLPAVPPAPAARPAPRPRATPRPPTAARPHPAALARVILARPLFTPGRRPPPAAAPAPAGQPRLSGVILSPGADRALLLLPGGSHPVAAAQGEQAGAWTVTAIAADAVHLLGPGGILVLRGRFAAPPEPSRSARAAGRPAGRRLARASVLALPR